MRLNATGDDLSPERAALLDAALRDAGQDPAVLPDPALPTLTSAAAFAGTPRAFS
jgi:hypothetical protein